MIIVLIWKKYNLVIIAIFARNWSVTTALIILMNVHVVYCVRQKKMKRTRAEVEAAIVAAQQSRETIVDELDKLQQELQEMPEPTLFEQVTNEMNELQKVIFEQDKASITKIIKDKSSKVILCRENKITINPKSAHIRHWLVQQGFFVDYITIPVYCSCDGWDKDCKCDNTKRKDAWCISWP